MDPTKCPSCGGKLRVHCASSDTCDLAECVRCGAYGKPEENRWVTPIPTGGKRETS